MVFWLFTSLETFLFCFVFLLVYLYVAKCLPNTDCEQRWVGKICHLKDLSYKNHIQTVALTLLYKDMHIEKCTFVHVWYSTLLFSDKLLFLCNLCHNVDQFFDIWI